ncbi:MAG: S8 family serine peptidase [Lachnospiraceae bacterium]
MKRKQVMACLLAATLFTTGLPQSVQAEQKKNQTTDQQENIVGTSESDLARAEKNVSVLDEMQKESTKKDSTEKEHAQDEIVTVIVEVKAASMLSLYQQSNSTNLNQFLEKNEAHRASIQKQVESVKNSILNLDQTTQEKAEFLYTYDTVFSGLSVKLPYSELEKIQKLPNVKNAFVASTYQLPKDQTSEDSLIHEMVNSGRNMIGSDKVQNKSDMNYTGKGQTIAVIDSGLSYKHEAFTKKPEDQHYDAQKIQALLDKENFASESDFQTNTRGTLNATAGDGTSSVYKSDKVPYAYDYTNHDTDVTPTNANNHGTHVSGIAAGNSDKIQGVAPDAQLMMLKVFDDNGTSSDAALLAALQDAVLLQPDSINMSLGTDAGFSVDSDEAMQKVYDNVKSAGINLDVAAGNSTTSTNYSQLGNDATTENIDNGIVSNPSTLNASLSVASVENVTVSDAMFITDSEGKSHEYTENATAGKSFSDLGKGTYTYVDCGTGKTEDFNGKDVKDKIALIQRGGQDASGTNLTFSVKVQNAANAGAKAVIVYNNVDGVFGMQIDNNSYLVPAIAVTKSVGEKLISLMKNGEGVINFDPDEKANVESDQANQMSSFSSWGTTPDLGIKPEITAPGGNIYSAYYLNSDGSSAYGNMSGTSMASPHMAGASAVVRQYLKEKHPEIQENQLETMANTLVMSTATPLEDKSNENGSEKLYYPVRQQGAGMVNLESVVKTQAYMNVKGSERPKAELGYNEEGSYTFTTEIVNMGNKELSYDLNAAVQIPNYYVGSDGKTNFISQSDLSILNQGATVSFSGTSVSGKTVKVPANGKSEVTVKIQLDKNSDTIKKYSEIFKNGFYVEGYLFAKSKSADTTDLNVPYLGFYGDWGKESIFDASAYDKDANPVFATSGLFSPSIGGSWYSQGTQITIGQNPLAVLGGEENVDLTADKDHMVISPNSQYVYEAIPSTILLRGVDKLEYKVTDKNNQTVKDYSYDYVSKSIYMATASALISAETRVSTTENEIYFDGKDSSGKALEEGDYQFTIEGTKAGVKDGKNKTEKASYTVTVDNTAPVLDEKNSVIYEKDGKVYVSVAATDNHGLAGFQLKVQKSNSGWWQSSSANMYKYSDCVDDDCQVFELGTKSELESAGYKLDSMTVAAYDYAMNYSTLTVKEGEEPERKPSTKPSEPSDVSKPEEPSDSSKPEEPSDESKPEKPSDSSRPEKPSDEDRPQQPSDISGPQNPSDGNGAEKPSDESKPEETSGSKPERPGSGSKPEGPSDGSKPAEPSDVSKPEEPSNGSKPERPGSGSKPQQPSEGSEAEEVEGIRLSDSKVNMTVGEEKNLIAYALPSGKMLTNVLYQSDDTDVADVTSEGTISAKKAGTAKITVMTMDKKIKTVCEVTVKDAPESPSTSAPSQPSQSESEVTGIELSDEEIHMAPGDRKNIKAYFTPTGTVVDDAKFDVEDSSVAAVTSDGKVIARKAGTTIIKVQTKDGKYQAECKIVVEEPKKEEEATTIDSIILSSEKMNMTVGEVRNLIAIASPSGTILKDAVYKSSDESVVTVSESGAVTAVGAGTAMITVKTKDDSCKSICSVEVTPAATTPSVPSTPSGSEPSTSDDESVSEITGVDVKNTSFGVMEISWDRTAGVTGYEIYRKSDSQQTYQKVGTVSSSNQTSYEDKTDITFGKTYTYKVCAFITKDGQTIRSKDSAEISAKALIPNKPVVKKAASQKNGTIAVQFAKVSGAAGYEVYRGTSKNGTYQRLTKTTKTSVVDNQKHVFGKTYYYRVRAYVKNGSKTVYGAFSNAVSVKCVHFGTMKLNAVKKVSPTKLKISWSKTEGAQKYELYRSTAKNGSYKKVKVINNANATSCIDNTVKKKKTYYYKIRPVGKNGSKTVNGSFSAVKAGKTR